MSEGGGGVTGYLLLFVSLLNEIRLVQKLWWPMHSLFMANAWCSRRKNKRGRSVLGEGGVYALARARGAGGVIFHARLRVSLIRGLQKETFKRESTTLPPFWTSKRFCNCRFLFVLMLCARLSWCLWWIGGDEEN